MVAMEAVRLWCRLVCWLLVCATCTLASDYHRYIDQDIDSGEVIGKYIRDLTRKQCIAECDTTADCKGASWRSTDGKCWLRPFGDITTLTPLADVDSYVRLPDNPPVPPYHMDRFDRSREVRMPQFFTEKSFSPCDRWACFHECSVTRRCASVSILQQGANGCLCQMSPVAAPIPTSYFIADTASDVYTKRDP